MTIGVVVQPLFPSFRTRAADTIITSENKVHYFIVTQQI